MGAGNAVIVALVLLMSLALAHDADAARTAPFAEVRRDARGAAVADSAAPPAPNSAALETRLDSVVVLPEVVVERERALDAARRRRPTGFVTELSPDAVPRTYETAADLLRQAAGVHVVQYGGLGAFSTVSLRGAPAGQVAVYVDGVPMQSAARTVVNLAELPMGSIETIEVYRGGAPLSLGPGRPGGAIQLTTAIGAGASARVTRGSFDTWDVAARAGATRGAFAAAVHGGYQGSDGDYRYLNDNGTPFNPGDDVEAVRVNNRFDMAHGGARLEWRPDDRWRVRAAGKIERQGQGFPGLGSIPALDARARLLSGDVQSSIERWFSGGGRVEWSGLWQADRRRFGDPMGRLGLGRHLTDDRFRAIQTALHLETPERFDVRLEGGVSLRGERATLRDALDGRPDPPPSTRRTQSARAGVRWRPGAGPVLLVADQRWDRSSDRLHAATPGPAGGLETVRETRSPELGARLMLGGGVELRANWAQAERVPDFLELFGDQGGVSGNPSLRPERVVSRDAGLAWSGRMPLVPRASLAWAHFESNGEDFIVFVRQSQTAVKAQNVARARIRGEELSLAGELPLGFELAAALTWQSAIDQGDVPFWRGHRLPQRPGRESYARLGWKGGVLRASLEGRFVGDSYRDRANQQRVPSRTLVDASFSWTPGDGPFRFTLEGRNLGDRRVADVAGYPLPGRSLLASIDWHAGR